MKLKYEVLNSANFYTALKKLLETDFDFKTSYRLKRIADMVEREAKILNAKMRVLFSQYSTDGKTIDDGKKEAWEVTFHDFMETTFEMKWEKISPDDLSKANLSANDIMELSPILELPSEEHGQAEKLHEETLGVQNQESL